MVKLTEGDKNYIKLLILDCETFHLNKKESLAYISKKLNRKISRTSYYNCKKETSEKESLAYLKDRGFDISVPYYYRLKKNIQQSRFDRLNLNSQNSICRPTFREN